MEKKGLQVITAILCLLIPGGVVMATAGSSANYTLEIADLSGSGLTGSSVNYNIDSITDDNFEANSDTYNLCGGLPAEAFGDCGYVAPPPPPPPPPPPGGGGGGGGSVVIPPDEEEPPLSIEPEGPIPPQIITFPDDEFIPTEEPQPPVVTPEPQQPAVTEPNISDSASEHPSAEETEQIILDQLPPSLENNLGEGGCYGNAKVLLRPAAMEQPTCPECDNTARNCLVIILIVISIILLLIVAYLLNYEKPGFKNKLKAVFRRGKTGHKR